MHTTNAEQAWNSPDSLPRFAVPRTTLKKGTKLKNRGHWYKEKGTDYAIWRTACTLSSCKLPNHMFCGKNLRQNLVPAEAKIVEGDDLEIERACKEEEEILKRGFITSLIHCGLKLLFEHVKNDPREVEEKGKCKA